MTTSVIIGGGITGMYIAERLSADGHEVIVLEKAPDVGGMCKTFEYDDFLLDYGPHKFYTQLSGVYDEFKRIVGKGNYLKVKKKNSIRLQGKYFEFPPRLTQLLTGISPILGIKVMLGFAKSQVTGLFKKSESFEDLLVKGFGKTGYELLFGQYARKIWGDPKKLSEELARRRVPVTNVLGIIKNIIFKPDQDTSAEYFLYPKKGYGVMTDNLAKMVKKNKGKIVLNCEVQDIVVKDGEVKKVVYKDKNGKKKTQKCDYLVSTIPIDTLPGYFKPKPPKKVFSAAKNLKFRSMVITYVFVDKDRVLDDNWIFFPEKEFCFNRVSEQKNFSREMGPKGKTVLMVEITCSYGDKTYKMSDDELKKMIVKDLEKAGLVKKEDVYDFFSTRAGRVYPVYSIGYKKYLNKVLDYTDKLENFYTVGRAGLFNYNNADHCIDMGRVTAEHIIEDKEKEAWQEARDYFDTYRIVD